MALMEKHNPGRKCLSLLEEIKEAAHSLLQHGPVRRKQAPEHPSPPRDLMNVHDSGCGRKKRKDTKGAVSAERLPPIMQVLESTKLPKLKSQQKHNPLRQHQSLSASVSGRCQWPKCPGFIAAQERNWKRTCRKKTGVPRIRKINK